ncbi:MAG TPA: hypothetical protein VNS32_17555 [Flavisolibacter sp.]|nr:hypothetical protein [Flavisolibacter sp.]
MKTKMKLLGTCVLSVLTLTAILFSCKKTEQKINNATDIPSAVSLTASASVSQAAYDDVFGVVMQEGETHKISGRYVPGYRLQSCATVTLSPADTTTFPKTMTIDFGSGCVSPDGVTRKGKLIVSLSGMIRNIGSILSVAFENYYVNGFKVEGTYSIKNNTSNNVLSFITQTVGGKVTYPDGTTYVTHTGTHTYTQTSGSATPSFADDSWSVTGSGNTANSKGDILTVIIKTALLKNVICQHITSGAEEFTYNNLKGTLDFGNGTCDDKATLTIGNYSTEITLP